LGTIKTIQAYLISILLLCLTSGVSLCQSYNIRTFTTKDGLPHDNVRSVAIDSSGFLWAATWDGLSRFDGHDFKNYYHIPGDSTSLPYFSVMKVLVDGGCNIWILTDDFIVLRYDINIDRFVSVNDSLGEGTGKGLSISIDEDGFLWVIKYNALLRFDFRKNCFDKYFIQDPDIESYKLGKGCYSVSIAEKGKLWVTESKIFEFEICPSGSTLKLKKVYPYDTRIPITDLDFSHVFEFSFYASSSGEKWVFSNHGLYQLDEKEGLFKRLKVPPSEKKFTGRKFFYWSHPEDGIYIYNTESGKLLNIPKEKAGMVKAVYCQNQDLLWFSSSTFEGSSLGLSQVIFTPDYFKNYSVTTASGELPAIYTIQKDIQNNIWLGLRGSDPLRIITPENNLIRKNIPSYKTTSKSNPIRLIRRVDGGMWIGFYINYLYYYDYRKQQFTRYKPEGTNNYRALAADKDGNLYLGNEGLYYYKPASGEIELLWKNKPLYTQFVIRFDDKGTVWVTMNKSALLRYNPVNKEVKEYKIASEEYNVEDICQGENGTYWLALLGGGVCHFNPETGSTEYYTTSRGLSNNTTYSILRDKIGFIWVSTDKGISRINSSTGSVTTFGLNEGLKIIEFNSGASFVGDDGEFFMGGMGGIVSFYPERIDAAESEIQRQKVLINEVSISGEKREYRRAMNEVDTVVLNKGETNFQVSFSSSDFTASDKTVFRYILSGINSQWIETSYRNRSINYSNLKPGFYRLTLQASDRSGDWSPSKEMIFRVTPYFYQSKAFLIATPLFFLILVCWTLFLRIRNMKQREAQIQNSLRMQALRGQMNPHFIFNSLNSINYFISNNDQLSANNYIADFSRLIRNTLYNLDKNFVPFENELSTISDYLKMEHLRVGDKFSYEIIRKDSLEESSLEVVPGLIQPFIENAIWHGIMGLENRTGFINISFSEPEEDKMKCIIEDDGLGVRKTEASEAKNTVHKSKGIQIVMERLRIMAEISNRHYDLQIEDLYPGRSERGTRVVIELPVRFS